MKKRTAGLRIKCLAVLLPLLFLVVSFLMTVPAGAQEPNGRIRVGWFESSFNTMDRYGRRSGYGYEYQLKISAYTGWQYEYINGSWPELMQMLEDGEIDLLSDVSYTPERSEKMLFSSLPMGTEEYYLFIVPTNQEISLTDYTTLDGKRIGVNKGSIQAGFYLEWAQQAGIRTELVEVTCSEDESIRLMESGELDAYVTVDAFTDPDRLIPVCKIGQSDYYFAVSRNRPELLDALNEAMHRIQDENRYYNLQMVDRYMRQVGANAFLSSDDVQWLSAHGRIRVGYQDNYLAFCGMDRTTGELTGALKDYLEFATDCIKNAQLEFEPIAFQTAAAAMEALARGDVDCVFPANLSGYDGETKHLIMTSPLMTTDMYAVVRTTGQNLLFDKKHVIVAVNEGNPNYDVFLLEHFPDWTKVYYPDTLQCLEAVADGVADCVLISNYRYNNIARICEKYHLMTLTTGIGLDYCFAVGSGQTQLYSILTKVAGLVPNSTINTALSFYAAEDARMTAMDFVLDNLPAVASVGAVVLLLILFLMFRSMRAERKAKKLISATETDELTGLYNRDFFFQYANRRYREHPDLPMDAIVLNIEQFHSVNALNGREFGDQILRILGNEIRTVAMENNGIAGRFEADRFDIYCCHTEAYQEIFDRLQKVVDNLGKNASVRLRMGVMPWQKNTEPVQMFDMARTACSMARGHYKEHLVIFNEEVRKREIYEQRLLNDLKRALNNYEFEVYYQPKYDIQSDPPRLVSAEALIRWNHPELGKISPGDFIPLFERNGRIGEVDKYVWTEAAKQIMRWREHYGVTIPISVNLSRVDVFDPVLEKPLEEIIAYYGLNRTDLKLEVTESAYTENASQVIRVVESLRQKGYEVEMDDFGSGYSSLNMLSAMPIDVLKMDSAFIQNIEHDEKDIQLVALILGIAKNLNVPVIAEGVETESQLQLLKKLGCELVQGYYFSRPLPSTTFESTFVQNMQSAT